MSLGVWGDETWKPCDAVAITEMLFRMPKPITRGLVVNRPACGMSFHGRLFQAHMWREYAALCLGAPPMTTRDDLVSRLMHPAFGVSNEMSAEEKLKALIAGLEHLCKEAASALEAKDAEIARLTRKHIAATEHNKISLQFLAGTDKLLTAAESRITSLERQLAEERERCARIAKTYNPFSR